MCIRDSFHIGESTSPNTTLTDEVIIEAVRNLNLAFAGLREPGSELGGNTPQGIDMEIDFCLANFNPDGSPTNGINRIDVSNNMNYRINGVTEHGEPIEKIKNLSAWPVHDYLNIWVFHKINLARGFASHPVGDKYDGIALEHDYVRRNTLIHEVGHWLDLYHTFLVFFGDNPCQDNDCLNRGDRVCDTPPGNSEDICDFTTCADPPESYINMANFMSYCVGEEASRFTQGQKERMHLALDGPIRGPLDESKGCSGESTSTRPILHIQQFDLMPNPAKNRIDISLSLDKSIAYQLELVDIYGNEIWKSDSLIESSEHTLDLQHITPGTYLCIFRSESIIEAKKLILLK